MSRYEIVPPDERPNKSERQTPSATPQTPVEPELTPEERSERAQAHRLKVTRWLCEGFEAGTANACLIGPGVAGHVDLSSMLAHFSELHIVDVEQANVDQAFEAVGLSSDSVGVTIHQDLFGLQSILGDLETRSEESELRFHDVQEAVMAAHAMPAWPLDQEFDIVFSAENVGWILSRCAAVIGHEHPSFQELSKAVFVRHMRELVRLGTEQGIGIIINQLVNSKVMPSLPKVPDNQLELVLSELVTKKLIPAGSSPVKMRDVLVHDQEIRQVFAKIHLLRPWVFDAGAIQYAMSGVSYRVQPPSADLDSEEPEEKSSQESSDT